MIGHLSHPAHSLSFCPPSKGLMIKDHVADRVVDAEGGTATAAATTAPILVVSSLWRQACMRLLDLDLESALDAQSRQEVSADSTTNAVHVPIPFGDSGSMGAKTYPPTLSGVGGTWDQRFFSQVQLTDSARTAIQDMMLNILRVAVRCVLSRDGVHSCDLALEGDRQHSVTAPPSIKH